jgi:hypothetical protein
MRETLGGTLREPWRVVDMKEDEIAARVMSLIFPSFVKPPFHSELRKGERKAQESESLRALWSQRGQATLEGTRAARICSRSAFTCMASMARGEARLGGQSLSSRRSRQGYSDNPQTLQCRYHNDVSHQEHQRRRGRSDGKI